MGKSDCLHFVRKITEIHLLHKAFVKTRVFLLFCTYSDIVLMMLVFIHDIFNFFLQRFDVVIFSTWLIFFFQWLFHKPVIWCWKSNMALSMKYVVFGCPKVIDTCMDCVLKQIFCSGEETCILLLTEIYISSDRWFQS